jgi:hypothetical protein
MYYRCLLCVYQGQFGFGDAVSDLGLKYAGEGNTTLKGPFSVIVSSQESYIPKAKS